MLRASGVRPVTMVSHEMGDDTGKEKELAKEDQLAWLGRGRGLGPQRTVPLARFGPYALHCP